MGGAGGYGAVPALDPPPPILADLDTKRVVLLVARHDDRESVICCNY